MFKPSQAASLTSRLIRAYLRPRSTSRAFAFTPRTQADPWILPGTPEHVALTDTSSSSDASVDEVVMVFPPIPRPDENLSTTRARLLYQVRKRGTLETDLLLSTFATKQRLQSMDADQLHEFDKLLDEPDWDIYYWSTNKRTPPPRWDRSKILGELRKHAMNEGRVVRRMPDL